MLAILVTTGVITDFENYEAVFIKLMVKHVTAQSTNDME